MYVFPMKNGGYSSQLCDRLPEGYDPYSLSQWLNGFNFRTDHMFSRKHKVFKLLSQGPLAE